MKNAFALAGRTLMSISTQGAALGYVQVAPSGRMVSTRPGIRQARFPTGADFKENTAWTPPLTPPLEGRGVAARCVIAVSSIG